MLTPCPAAATSQLRRPSSVQPRSQPGRLLSVSSMDWHQSGHTNRPAQTPKPILHHLPERPLPCNLTNCSSVWLARKAQTVTLPGHGTPRSPKDNVLAQPVGLMMKTLLCQWAGRLLQPQETTPPRKAVSPPANGLVASPLSKKLMRESPTSEILAPIRVIHPAQAYQSQPMQPLLPGMTSLSRLPRTRPPPMLALAIRQATRTTRQHLSLVQAM
ncbi:hypothetical protein ES708_21037 [subsurface metagenome]